MSDAKTHYEILGLNPEAPPEQVKKRYRELARQYHPDLHPEHPEYHAVFLRINQAFEVLSDATRRATYDLDLRAEARRKTERQSGSFGAAAGPRAAGGNGAARRGTPGAAAGAGRETTARREAERRRQMAARLLDEARVSYSRGYLKQAQRLCEEALQSVHHGGAYDLLGDIYTRQGKLEQAMQNYALAAQLIPNNGLIMAKFNRTEAQIRGKGLRGGTAPRANVRVLAPLARLSYKLTVTSLGAAIILFLIFWWPSFRDASLEWPFITHWTVSQLAFTGLVGLLAGMVLASSAWLRPFEGELCPWLGNPRRVIPLNLILGLFATVFLPLAFVAYLSIGYVYGAFSSSVLLLFGTAAALACGFAFAAPPQAQTETLLFGGNLLFVTMLCGWFIGDIFRPSWAR